MNDDDRRRQLRWAERNNKMWGGPGLYPSGCLGSLGCALAFVFLAFVFFLLIYWLI
jgi:hypothetical protein